MARMKAAKPAVMKRQMALLEERYDLSNRAAQGVTMSRNKPVQAGVRVKLTGGVDLGRAGGDESGRNPGEGRVPGRLSASAASQSSRRRHAVPEVSY